MKLTKAFYFQGRGGRIMRHGEQATIFLVIFTWWICRLYIRVYDRVLKNYTIWIGINLIFWMILKIIRSFTTGNINNLLWYLYYIPLLFIPAFYFNCSHYLLHNKGNSLRKITLIISSLLFFLIMTNNYHYCDFILYEGTKYYVHNWGYYLVCVWIFLLLIMAIVNLVKVSLVG